MLRPFRAICATVIFSAVALSLTDTAQATLTEADRRSNQAFAECLGRADRDQEACLKELGYQAWYPQNDSDCEETSARIANDVAASGQADWRSLFLNERCARLELPHNIDAAKSGHTTMPGSTQRANSQPFVVCLRRSSETEESCFEELGRQSWYPLPYGCHMLEDLLKDDHKQFSWKLLFYNERCARLGLPHFQQPAK